MSEGKDLEARIVQLENEVKRLLTNASQGVIRYKKCHDCQSDLVPPLKVVNMGVGANILQYIECPICLGQTSCMRQIPPEKTTQLARLLGTV